MEKPMWQWLLISLGACLLAAPGCSPETPPPLAARAQADFVNGDFEAGDLTGWTVVTNLNNGIATMPPTTIAHLNLAAGGTNKTAVKMGATPESQIPSGLAVGDSLRYPRFGKYCTVINELGSSDNSNHIYQELKTSQADVDAFDGKIHIRFALAPVLQNPAHTPTAQPYFYLELRNVTKNTVLFNSFNFSGQAGVPWKEALVGAVQYTDWQLFDVAPGPTAIAIGDTLRMDVIASGCSQGGHWGHLYLDGFGSFIPGLTVAASAPQSANAGTNITYTFNAKNGGTAAASGVIVKEVLPANTTFVSASGATCTTPAVGAIGTVACQLGMLNAGAGATFEVTVRIDSGTTGTINNGNYTIEGMGISPLIGPLVQTAVTSGVVYTDLSLSVTNGRAALAWGAPVTYTVVATNKGPSAVTGAKISNSLPAELSGVTWSCTGAGGGVCGAASGSGALNTTADLPVGASATYQITGTVIAGTGMGLLNYLVSIAPPAGITDGTTNNNTAIDTDNVGQLVGLSFDKGASTGTGTVTSSPAAIQCGPTCSSQSAMFLSGSSVTLTAVAAAGSTFTGWGGACASQGTAQQCTVLLSAAQSVSASFSLPEYDIVVTVPGGNGMVTCPGPVVQGHDVTCAITPATGYELDTLSVDGTDALATVSGSGFTLGNVQGQRTVQATFKKARGTGCDAASECHTGFCASGVCCDQACTSGCQSCSLANQTGTCTSMCGSFACSTETNACFSSCQTDAECAGGSICGSGSCVAPESFSLAGGGFSCEYGGMQSASAGGKLGFLAVLACLVVGRLRRRRRGADV